MAKTTTTKNHEMLTLFLILRRIFFRIFSSVLLNGNSVGMSKFSCLNVRFSSSVSSKGPEFGNF